MKSRAHSFTSLMADLHQDINRVSLSGSLMENFLEEIAPLRLGTLTQMRRVTNTNLLF